MSWVILCLVVAAVFATFFVWLSDHEIFMAVVAMQGVEKSIPQDEARMLVGWSRVLYGANAVAWMVLAGVLSMVPV